MSNVIILSYVYELFVYLIANKIIYETRKYVWRNNSYYRIQLEKEYAITY